MNKTNNKKFEHIWEEYKSKYSLMCTSPDTKRAAEMFYLYGQIDGLKKVNDGDSSVATQ